MNDLYRVYATLTAFDAGCTVWLYGSGHTEVAGFAAAATAITTFAALYQLGKSITDKLIVIQAISPEHGHSGAAAPSDESKDGASESLMAIAPTRPTPDRTSHCGLSAPVTSVPRAG
jgi:hypothetical protein